MLKVFILAVLLAAVGEFVARKFFPKVKAEAVAVSQAVSTDVASVKAKVASVEAKLKP